MIFSHDSSNPLHNKMDFSDDYSFAEFCITNLSPLCSYDEDLTDSTRTVATATTNSGRHSQGCNCKNSKCLKMYCECFARGKKCGGCNCRGCLNTESNNSLVIRASLSVLRKNPLAFSPSQQGTVSCNCSKSGCTKKYCRCFLNSRKCTAACQCTVCKNS